MKDHAHPHRFRVAMVYPQGAIQTQMALPPLGLGFLIKYYELHGLHKEQVEFRIFDENARKHLVEDVVAWQPNLVGISAMSFTRSRAFDFATHIRGRLPRVVIVGGGVHFQVDPDDGLQCHAFDAVCTGEGEEPLRAIIDEVLIGPAGRQALDQIPNLAWRDEHGRIRKTEHWLLKDLTSLPMPDMERFDLSFYLARRQFVPAVFAKSTIVLTGRGCPFKCTFCFNSFRDGRVRQHDIHQVVEHLARLRSKYGLRHISITDDLFLVNRDRVRTFCERVIKEMPDLRWGCQARPSLIREDDLVLFKLMAQAGCIQINFGFECGCETVLKAIKGPDASLAKNQRALDLAWAAGLPVFGYFMCGIPGETEEQMYMTGEFIRKNFKKFRHFELFIYTPYPGSALAEQTRAEGLLEGVSIDDLAVNNLVEGEVRVFNRLVSAEKVRQFRQEMKRMAMAKFPLRDKLRWLWVEGRDNPRRTFKRLVALYKRSK